MRSIETDKYQSDYVGYDVFLAKWCQMLLLCLMSISTKKRRTLRKIKDSTVFF